MSTPARNRARPGIPTRVRAGRAEVASDSNARPLCVLSRTVLSPSSFTRVASFVHRPSSRTRPVVVAGAVARVDKAKVGDAGGGPRRVGARGVGQRENPAMTTIRWFRSGTPPRGTPAFRRPPGRHPVVMLVLGLAALSQTGCQSGPVRRVRPLREQGQEPQRADVPADPQRRPGAGKCCGGDLGVAAAPGVQYGYGSPSVVTPAPIVGPSSSGTTTVVPELDRHRAARARADPLRRARPRPPPPARPPRVPGRVRAGGSGTPRRHRRRRRTRGRGRRPAR